MKTKPGKKVGLAFPGVFDFGITLAGFCKGPIKSVGIICR